MIFSGQKNHEKCQPAVAGRFYPAEREALFREQGKGDMERLWVMQA